MTTIRIWPVQRISERVLGPTLGPVEMVAPASPNDWAAWVASMNTSATVTARPRSGFWLFGAAGEAVEADGGEGVGSPLSLPLSVGECRQFGFSLGEGFLDDAAVYAGELSPQFEDRFVQAGLDHQIATLKHVLLVGRGDLSEAVQQSVQPAQRV